MTTIRIAVPVEIDPAYVAAEAKHRAFLAASEAAEQAATKADDILAAAEALGEAPASSTTTSTP